MYLKQSKFLIVGMSKSGISSCELLLLNGAQCWIYDKNFDEKIEKNIQECLQLGATLVNKENVEDVIAIVDIVVLSPGVAIDSEVPIIARKLRKNIIGELELGYYFMRGAIVGVTGTNGKTTTCSMIDYILNNAGYKCNLAGNIGIALTKVCKDSQLEDVSVVEVSSFQLETIARFAPHVACVLNISPDHLSRHYNMDNYIYLKSRILKNLRESEYAVLNADDAIVNEFSKNTRAKSIYFSMVKEVDGAYFLNGEIYWKGERLCNMDDLALKQGHNIQNALATICVCKILGVEKDIIVDGLCTFKGVKHRLQEVLICNGVKFINDSKATNPASTLSAINSIKDKFVLLLGGRAKQGGYEELIESLKNNPNFSELIVYGECNEMLFNLAKKNKIQRVNLTHNFEQAVKLAFAIRDINCVLLSPACASYDEFSCFEERGEKFIELINEFSGIQGENN